MVYAVKRFQKRVQKRHVYVCRGLFKNFYSKQNFKKLFERELEERERDYSN